MEHNSVCLLRKLRKIVKKKKISTSLLLFFFFVVVWLVGNQKVEFSWIKL